MNDSRIDIPTKPKRKIGCLSLSIAAFFAIILIVGLTFFAWNTFATKRFNAATAAMQAAGYATTPAELEATYRAGTNSNPAPLWVEAGKNFVADNAADTRKLPFIGPEAADEDVEPGAAFGQIDNARTYLARHQHDFELVRRAANNPNPARYDGPLVVSAADAFPSKQELFTGHRQISRALAIRAMVEAHDQDLNALSETLHQDLRVGPSLMDEPTVMSQLVAAACFQMALSQVENYLPLDFTDDQLKSLQESLRDIDLFKKLRRGLEGEVVHNIVAFKDPMTRGPLPRYEDGAFLVEQVLLLLETSEDNDWNKLNAEVQALDSRIAELQQSPAVAARYMLSTNILTSYCQLGRCDLRLSALIRTHDALIATRRFQLRHGQPPKQLGDLIPEFLPQIPIDPFSADREPLRFELRTDKVLIYSRGFNGEDDGGSDEPNLDPAGFGMLDIPVELKIDK